MLVHTRHPTFGEPAYETPHVQRLADEGCRYPNARGFDEFYGFCSGHWGDYFSPMLEHNGEMVQGNGFVIDDFTERAMDFIETNRDEPFLVCLPYNTPHSPMQVPDRWWSKAMT